MFDETKGMVSEGLIQRVFDAQKDSIDKNTEALQKLAESMAEVAALVNNYPKDSHYLLVRHHEIMKRLYWLVGGGMFLIGTLLGILQCVVKV